MFVKVLRTMSQYFIVMYVCSISRHHFLLNVIVRKTNVAMKECKNLNEYIYLYFIQHFLKKSPETNAEILFCKYVFCWFQLKVRPFEGAADTHFFAI